MKKLLGRFAAALAVALIAAPVFAVTPVAAFATTKSRVYDDFNRQSLGVTEPGNTGSGVEPDDTWVHNPDGFVVYWIQFNNTTKPSVEGNALKFEVTGQDGWVGFGMTGDYKDHDYDAFSIKLKGSKGGEESRLYFNIGGVFDFHWDNARDPDGNPLPKITTSYQTFTISLDKSGMGATKAQRNMMNNGWTDFHINSTDGPLTVYIDEIKQVQTHPYKEITTAPEAPGPVTPAQNPAPADAPANNTPAQNEPQAAAPDAALEEPTTTAPEEPVGELTFAETDRPLNNSFLVDDWNRASLMLDPEMEVAPGGEFGRPNTDGNVVYWISWNDNTRPEIINDGKENGVLKLATTGNGWYGTATDMAFLDEYNCIAFRIKGENGGEDGSLTFNPDTLGAKKFADLIGPDGNPVPPITTDWQTIVIDFVKSGWKGLPEKEYYQNIHLNTEGALTVYIDEVYFTAVNLGDDAPPPATREAAIVDTPVDTPADTPQEIAEPVVEDAAPAENTAPEAASTTAAKTGGGAGKIVIVVILAIVVVGAIGGAVILLTKKPKQK